MWCWRSGNKREAGVIAPLENPRSMSIPPIRAAILRSFGGIRVKKGFAVFSLLFVLLLTTRLVISGLGPSEAPVVRNTGFIEHVRPTMCSPKDVSQRVTVIVKSIKADNFCWFRLVRTLRNNGITSPILIGVEEDQPSAQQRLRSFGDVRFVALGNDAGLGYGRNMLLSAVKTEFTFLLDDDFLFSEDRGYVEQMCTVLAALDSRKVDLVGGCTHDNCKAYMLSKPSTHELDISEAEISRDDVHAITTVDMVDNFFIARTSSLRAVLWDTNLKVGEHEDFFIRAQGKIRVGFYPPLTVSNDRSCRTVGVSDSAVKLSLYHRSRVFAFWKSSFAKHGITRMRSLAGIYDLICPGDKGTPDFAIFQTAFAQCNLEVQADNPWGTANVPDLFPPLAHADTAPLPAGQQCSVALMTVAIGRYMEFVPDLWASMQKYFVPMCTRHLYVFTDDIQHEVGLNAAVHLIPQERLGWPYDSLMRFEMYATQREVLLKNFDYVYAVDSDAVFVGIIGREVLSKSVATLSAWYHGRSRFSFPYDANPSSPFYLHSNEGRAYFAGGFYGGKVAHVVPFWERVSLAVRYSLFDMQYVPPWHDESIMNHEFNKIAPPTVILGPEYLYPEPPADNWLLAYQRLYYKYDDGNYRPGREPKLLNLGVRKATDKTLRSSAKKLVEGSVVSALPSNLRPMTCSALSITTAGTQECIHWIPGAVTIEDAEKECAKMSMHVCTLREAQKHVKHGAAICLPSLAIDESAEGQDRVQIVESNLLSQCDPYNSLPSGKLQVQPAHSEGASIICCSELQDNIK